MTSTFHRCGPFGYVLMRRRGIVIVREVCLN